MTDDDASPQDGTAKPPERRGPTEGSPEHALMTVPQCVATAADLLAEGYTWTRIIRQLMERTGRGRSACADYIERARTTYLPALYNLDNYRSNVAQALSRAMRLHERAIDAASSDNANERAASLKTALGAQRWIGELHGLTATFAAHRLREMVGDARFASMSDAEMLSAMADIVKQNGGAP